MTDNNVMTREQWKDLARFCGGRFVNDKVLGPMLDWSGKNGGGYTAPWHPDSDWRDFGPLWRLIERWRLLPTPKGTPVLALIPLLNALDDAAKGGH